MIYVGYKTNSRILLFLTPNLVQGVTGILTASAEEWIPTGATPAKNVSTHDAVSCFSFKTLYKPNSRRKTAEGFSVFHPRGDS